MCRGSRPSSLAPLATAGAPTWSQRQCGIGGFGGGSLQHPRHWLGVQWAGPLPGVPSCPEPPGVP
eukprot:scaffold15887_cov59-Phaeocystis_antarctica.AAC.3